MVFIVAVNEFSDDEMNILTTALANLCNTRVLCKVTPNIQAPERTKFRFVCSDGKKRRLERREVIALNVKIARLAGHEIKDIEGLLQEAGMR